MAYRPMPLEPLKEADDADTSTPTGDSPSSGHCRSPSLNLLQSPDFQPFEISEKDSEGLLSKSDDSPRDPGNELGIFSSRKSSAASLRRKPVASRTDSIPVAEHSAPNTPHPNQSLLSSPEPPSHEQQSFLGSSRFADKSKFGQEKYQEDPKITEEASSGAGSDKFDDEELAERFGKPPTYCSSRRDITTPRKPYVPSIILLVSIYSTTMSLLWLIVSFVQPGLGGFISSSQRPNQASIAPGTATSLTTLLAKTIEMSFGTVFVTFLGQVLSKRSLVPSKGLTLAEMDLRNWVIQPGCFLSHFEALRYNMRGLLGWLTVAAAISTMFYTTASDALVSPKLRNGKAFATYLSGPVRSSYANANFVQATCPNLFKDATGDKTYLEAEDGPACLSVQMSGQSYRDLLSFMSMWSTMRGNGTLGHRDLARRPKGTNLLYHNTTMTAAWVETWNSNVTASHEKYQRIVNNVTMAIPHPGVYAAATSPKNTIQQPHELAGIGGYMIRASVVSPAINVMCVDMSKEDVKGLIYDEWPNHNPAAKGDKWKDDIPVSFKQNGEPEYLNTTTVDDIFKWGPKYGRRPPVFLKYPAVLNFVSNMSLYNSDSVYLLGLGSTAQNSNFTLCEMRSWLSPNCSTHFNISGSGGIRYEAHCEDPSDVDAYRNTLDPGEPWPEPSKDWKWLAQEWGTTNNMNSGVRSDNAANNRILTQLALTEPQLPSNLPSLAEALAVFIGSTLVMGSVQTPYNHTWNYPGISKLQETDQSFRATVIPQEYTSYHTLPWQSVFYMVFLLAAAINVFCLIYFICQQETVTDITLPENHFVLGMNSPPSAQLSGSCGGGPEKRDMVVPWRLAYAWRAKHYFFLAANETPWKGKYHRQDAKASHSVEHIRGRTYKRLSTRSAWLP